MIAHEVTITHLCMSIFLTGLTGFSGFFCLSSLRNGGLNGKKSKPPPGGTTLLYTWYLMERLQEGQTRLRKPVRDGQASARFALRHERDQALSEGQHV
jgi:hypothetical protein